MQNKLKQPNSNPLDAQRKAVLKAALPLVLFDGWSQSTLNHAAKLAHIDPALLPLLFSNGVIDVISFHSAQADAALITQYESDEDFQKLPVPIKIRTAILKRLEFAQDDKEAVRKGLTKLALPNHVKTGLYLLSQTCDTIWRLAGDRATDFNWYTKRITLAGIYSATLLFWLNDDSQTLDATAAFLDRRLAGVKAFGKWKSELQNNVKSYLPKRA